MTTSRKLVLVIFFCILLLTAGLVLIVYFAMETLSMAAEDDDGLMPPEPLVTTHCGIVLGVHHNDTNTYSFKGLRYAAPPLGSRRWRPPVPLTKAEGTCHEGIYSARDFAPMCPQPGGFFTPPGFIGDEDCLYLDIYTPTLDSSASLPVVVFTHGGGLLMGNSHGQGYSPNNDITKELQVVFVSIQYRLGALGFLTLEILRNRTGNYGVLDQIEALRWIQTNIQQFGGDPQRVTVFGHSGSASIALLQSPLAKGLFQRVWLSDPSPNIETTYQEVLPKNEFLLYKTGCASETCSTEECQLDCLYNLTAEALVNAINPEWTLRPFSLPRTDEERQIPYIVVDGTVVVNKTSDAWNGEKNPNLPDVPIVIGATAQAVDYLPALSSVVNWDRTMYNYYINATLETFSGYIADEALRLYPYAYTGEYSYATIVSDVLNTCWVADVAEAMARTNTAPVYLYITTAWPTSPFHAFHLSFAGRYAMHGLDVFAIFRHWAALFTQPPNQKDEQFANHLVASFRTFVSEGRTAHSDWLPLSSITALIDDTVTFLTRPYHEEACRFWADNDFRQYSWMN